MLNMRMYVNVQRQYYNQDTFCLPQSFSLFCLPLFLFFLPPPHFMVVSGPQTTFGAHPTFYHPLESGLWDRPWISLYASISTQKFSGRKATIDNNTLSLQNFQCNYAA